MAPFIADVAALPFTKLERPQLSASKPNERERRPYTAANCEGGKMKSQELIEASELRRDRSCSRDPIVPWLVEKAPQSTLDWPATADGAAAARPPYWGFFFFFCTATLR
jgi:hypothetical protein